MFDPPLERRSAKRAHLKVDREHTLRPTLRQSKEPGWEWGFGFVATSSTGKLRRVYKMARRGIPRRANERSCSDYLRMVNLFSDVNATPPDQCACGARISPTKSWAPASRTSTGWRRPPR